MDVYLSKCRGLSLSRHELSNVVVYSTVNTECVHSSLSIASCLSRLTPSEAKEFGTLSDELWLFVNLCHSIVGTVTIITNQGTHYNTGPLY